MNVIYHYPLEFDHGKVQSIEMPRFAKIMSAGKRKPDGKHDEVTIWALVNTAGEKETRKFVVFFTGSSIEGWRVDSDQYAIESLHNLLFIDTVDSINEGFVAHVFEVA